MEQCQENFGFCTACGAQLTGTAYCGNCGAKAPERKVEEVPAEIVAPVDPVAPEVPVAPAEPVVIEPAAPAAAPANKAFPLVPVILIGVAALMAFISMCGRFTFLNFMEFSCLSGLIVGMILCKKEQNLIVAIGFLALAFFGLIGDFVTMSRNISYGLPVLSAVLSLVFSMLFWLCDAAIGFTYLAAKPKMAVLKTLACAVAVGYSFICMICALIVSRGSGAGSLIFTFLLQTTTLYAGALLYTPYKK